jgi:hypothetical protein
MKKFTLFIVIIFTITLISKSQNLQQNPQRPQIGKRPNQTGLVNLDSLRWCDMCIVPDPATILK